MRSGLATGFNIKLSSVICHLSDDNPPLLGDNASLFGDNLPFFGDGRKSAFGRGKKCAFLRVFLAKIFGGFENFLYLCNVIRKVDYKREGGQPDVDCP